MGALRFIGFLLIIALVVAGLDYYQQDKKTEGTLSFAGYVETINQRFNLYQAELAAEEVERERKKRWSAGAKPYLPASGEAWVRRAIVDADYTRDAREGELQDNVSEAARPLARNVAVQKVEQLAAKLDRTSWVYENGDHTIWIRAQLREDANSSTLVGNIARTVEGMSGGLSEYTPFGIIGGVPYFQLVQNRYSVITADDRSRWSIITAGLTDLKADPGFDKYKATIGLGQEIRLQIYSDAPAPELRAFLEQLDYDGLNAVLRLPVPGVGNDAVSNPAHEIQLAEEMSALRGEFVNLRSELARLRLENIDGMSLVANTLVAQYGLPADTFDLTANKIDSPDDLVQVGYRQGLTDLLESEIQKSESEAGGVFNRLFATFQGDSSPEAAEPEAAGGGLLDGLMSAFGASDPDTETVVRVNKGGSGSSSDCMSKGAFKRCTLGGG